MSSQRKIIWESLSPIQFEKQTLRFSGKIASWEGWEGRVSVHPEILIMMLSKLSWDTDGLICHGKNKDCGLGYRQLMAVIYDHHNVSPPLCLACRSEHSENDILGSQEYPHVVLYNSLETRQTVSKIKKGLAAIAEVEAKGRLF